MKRHRTKQANEKMGEVCDLAAAQVIHRVVAGNIPPCSEEALLMPPGGCSKMRTWRTLTAELDAKHERDDSRYCLTSSTQ
jgi:hypothetical protein